MANIKDEAFKWGTSVHEAIFRASGGRLLGKAGGMPVLILETTGRHSGKARTTMLTSPVQDGDRVVIVASYGGDDRHPAWFQNLKANPNVRVTMGGRTNPRRARVADPDERSRYWPQVTSAYRGYAGYQTKTTREIPLVILEP